MDECKPWAQGDVAAIQYKRALDAVDLGKAVQIDPIRPKLKSPELSA